MAQVLFSVLGIKTGDNRTEVVYYESYLPKVSLELIEECFNNGAEKVIITRMNNYEEHKKQLLKDPEFRKAYGALSPKFERIRDILRRDSIPNKQAKV